MNKNGPLMLVEKRIMLIKIILISVVLLAVAGLAFGVRLLFNRNATLPSGSCHTLHGEDTRFECGCGGGYCAVQEGDMKEKN